MTDDRTYYVLRYADLPKSKQWCLLMYQHPYVPIKLGFFRTRKSALTTGQLLAGRGHTVGVR